MYQQSVILDKNVEECGVVHPTRPEGGRGLPAMLLLSAKNSAADLATVFLDLGGMAGPLMC